jgi:dolichol-phosphate mannosyltransferase
MSRTLSEWFKYEEEPAPFKRWLAFNLVGGLGILIQLSTLAALTAGLGLHYLLATGLAVEAAVLHNFLWHERWTWRDRATQEKPGRWKRLLRFQIANGALSLGGNLVLMQVLVSTWAINYTLANIVSITLCSILNFLASDHLVFARPRDLALQTRRGTPRGCPGVGGADAEGGHEARPYETRWLRPRHLTRHDVPKRPATV